MHKILECEYCGQAITVNDRKCPSCGASCSKQINKYLDEVKEEQRKKLESFTKPVSQAAKTTFFVIIGFSVVILAVFIFIIVSIFRNMNADPTFKGTDNEIDVVEKTEKEMEKIISSFKEQATSDEFNLTLDAAEPYTVVDFMLNNKNNPIVREGYQRVALHVVFENTSDKEVRLGFYKFNLLADGYEVERIDLPNDFYKDKDGKVFKEFSTSKNVSAGAKYDGYIGYEVPTNAKELEFKLENVTIKLDNPAYKG